MSVEIYPTPCQKQILHVREREENTSYLREELSKLEERD